MNEVVEENTIVQPIEPEQKQSEPVMMLPVRAPLKPASRKVGPRQAKVIALVLGLIGAQAGIGLLLRGKGNQLTTALTTAAIVGLFGVGLAIMIGG